MGNLNVFNLSCFIWLLVSLTTNAYAYEPLDKTVAIVEDIVILDSEIQQRWRHLQAKNPELSADEKIRRQILDQLILEQLQLRLADRAKLNIPDSEVEATLTHLKKRLATEGIAFANYLVAQKLDETKLRQSIRRDITIRKVQEGAINSRIQITDREIDEFLESKAGKKWLTPRFRLNHILLTFEDDDTVAIKKAQELYEQAKLPDISFQQLAATHSKGPNASKGGDLGLRTKDQLPALFVEQVATLDEGDITPPFRSGAGIHILQVNQRSGAKPVMVERYFTRHILIKPNQLFTDAEAKAKIDGLYQKLLEGADFIELAKTNTEDTSSKNSGGELGWSTPGGFVPKFERVMESTTIGRYSKPFRTQFGWHILKVEDQRTEDMFETVKRNQVVGILRQRRFQDELQLWLQELQENAYVEILI